MLYNKKGLSTVVTTLIIILLVLVAIGIIWVVVRGVIEDSGEQININTKCTTTNIAISDVGDCDGTSCIITVEKQGGYEFEGIKAVVLSDIESSEVNDESGNIEVSEIIPLSKSVESPTKVQASVYFTNPESGENVTCPQVAEYNIN